MTADHQPLAGRRALVTGGSAGIGRAIAALLAERGARVAINGRDAARLAESAGALGVPGVQGDVGEEEQAIRIVAEAVEQLGGLDILVNNAGWGRRMPVDEIDADAFLAMWRTNVLGCALMAREAIRHLADGGGDIVNIASTAARSGHPGASAYCATKFALRGMSQCWVQELRRRDIRVFLIDPSEVQTGFGGRDPDRPKDPHKLVSEDIAHVVAGVLEMHPRGFVPELNVFATNPWGREA